MAFNLRRTFIELRRQLDVRDVAEHERLGRKARHIDCPSCQRRLKALSRDGVAAYCVACEWRGDAVDLIRTCRNVDLAEAVRVACELAGIGRHQVQTARSVWLPRPRPLPAQVVLTDADREMRMRAITLAALHYRYLAGLASPDDDTPTASAHVNFVAEMGAFFASRVRRCDDAILRVPDLEAAREVAFAYLRDRIGDASWDDALPIVAEVVGICPSLDSGLRSYLSLHGGAGLVAAGERAGLFRWSTGPERFAGRLVYIWTDDRGCVSYLNGRSVPALADTCRHRRDDKGELRKVDGLPTWNPERRGDRLGVPAPVYPFGAHLAVRLEGTVRIVEGELDAIAELAGRVPAVATGGTGRMGNPKGIEALRRFLGGRLAIVRFDIERTPEKQAVTDERAERLALALGARVRFGSTP